MWYGLVFIYVDVYLGLGHLFAQMFLISFIAAIAISPVWYKLSGWFGKKNIWMVGMALVMVSFIYPRFLEPGETGFMVLLGLKLFNTFGLVCVSIMSLSMLSDIVDYGSLRFGTNLSGTYFSIKLFFHKLFIAVGGAVGLAIVGWYGFDARSTTMIQSLEGIEGLHLAMIWLPIWFLLIASILLVYMPINARRHRIVRRRLDKASPRVARF